MQVLDGLIEIETKDGRQRVRIARRSVAVVRDLPTAFQVVDLSHNGAQVVLHAADGRVVQATPGQLATLSVDIPPELNPEHDQHLEAEFLDVGTVPANDVEDPLVQVGLHDSRLGQVDPAPDGGFQALAVPGARGPLTVHFPGSGHARTTALLPTVHQLLDDLPTLLTSAADFLWHWGAGAADSVTGHDTFLVSFGVSALTVFHSGAFALDLSDDQTVFAATFLADYWPKIYFLPDRTPVFIGIEC